MGGRGGVWVRAEGEQVARRQVGAGGQVGVGAEKEENRKHLEAERLQNFILPANEAELRRTSTKERFFDLLQFRKLKGAGNLDAAVYCKRDAGLASSFDLSFGCPSFALSSTVVYLYVRKFSGRPPPWRSGTRLAWPLVASSANNVASNFEAQTPQRKHRGGKPWLFHLVVLDSIA